MLRSGQELYQTMYSTYPELTAHYSTNVALSEDYPVKGGRLFVLVEI